MKNNANKSDVFIDKIKTKASRKNHINPREFVLGDEIAIELQRDNYDSGEDYVWIQSIRAFETGKGSGSRIMKELCDLADQLGIVLLAEPRPFKTQASQKHEKGGHTKEELTRWYKRFGFKNSVNFHEALERKPKKKLHEMRDSMNLSENNNSFLKWNKVYSTETTIKKYLVNPTAEDLWKMYFQNGRSIRLLLSDDKKLLYAWKAYDGSHYDFYAWVLDNFGDEKYHEDHAIEFMFDSPNHGLRGNIDPEQNAEGSSVGNNIKQSKFYKIIKDAEKLIKNDLEKTKTLHEEGEGPGTTTGSLDSSGTDPDALVGVRNHDNEGGTTGGYYRPDAPHKRYEGTEQEPKNTLSEKVEILEEGRIQDNILKAIVRSAEKYQNMYSSNFDEDDLYDIRSLMKSKGREDESELTMKDISVHIQYRNPRNHKGYHTNLYDFLYHPPTNIAWDNVNTVVVILKRYKLSLAFRQQDVLTPEKQEYTEMSSDFINKTLRKANMMTVHNFIYPLEDIIAGLGYTMKNFRLENAEILEEGKIQDHMIHFILQSLDKRKPNDHFFHNFAGREKDHVMKLFKEKDKLILSQVDMYFKFNEPKNMKPFRMSLLRFIQSGVPFAWDKINAIGVHDTVHNWAMVFTPSLRSLSGHYSSSHTEEDTLAREFYDTEFVPEMKKEGVPFLVIGNIPLSSLITGKIPSNMMHEEIAPDTFSDNFIKVLDECEPCSHFAGCPVFEVSAQNYKNFRMGKNRYHRWDKYVDMTEESCQRLHAYAKKNPGRTVIIKNKSDGSMMYAHPKTGHHYQKPINRSFVEPPAEDGAAGE